jgi:hypothetical protein
MQRFGPVAKIGPDCIVDVALEKPEFALGHS